MASSPSSSSSVSALFKSLHSSRALNKGLEQARYAVMSTITEDGQPSARTVVVRDIYQDQAIVATTDIRSQKIKHLTAHSRAIQPDPSTLPLVTSPSSPFPVTELCWWFPNTKEQYRLLSNTLVISSTTPIPSLTSLRSSTWSSMSPPSRSQFEAAPPGSLKHRPAQGDLDRYEAQHPSVEVVSDNFALLLFYPMRVDYLYLPKAVVSPHPVGIEVEGGVKEGERDEHSQARWKLKWEDEGKKWTMQEVNP